MERLWTVEEVAKFLGVPVATLYQWRHHRTGPRSRKIGRHLRYLPEDVMSWVHEQE
ncbi:helix-turn-helix transcriptional regulator [Microbispora hainanensis]|uniref:helix-turn-helix transcriptional regulator n=1 Tax=Microbispora hainanensis TaxID=568844 RepID=UPI0033C727F7